MFVVLYNYYTRPFLQSGNPSDTSLVSIIIADLKDEGSTRILIDNLLKQTYQNIEVLVYVDSVNTPSIGVLRDYSSIDKRVKLIEAIELPEGWVRRNFIHDWLSQLSKGQFIIFIDAGISIGNEVVANALSYMQFNGLSLLTVFPRQVTNSQWSRILIEIKYWTLISMCPLIRVKSSGSISVSATANQFLMFEASSYKSYRWHQKYKGFEDVDFVMGRFVKNSTLRMASLLGDDEITIQASNSDFDNTTSFIFNFFGRNRNRLIVYTIASTIGPVMAVFLLPFPLVFLYLFSIFFAWMLFAMINGKSPLVTLLLLPIHHFAFLYIVFQHFKK